jgi:TRAP-type C4-dicarboxylate transport system permease small subunit
MLIVSIILGVYTYELYSRQEWAQKIMIDVLSLILLFIAVVLGILSMPLLLRFFAIIRTGKDVTVDDKKNGIE